MGKEQSSFEKKLIRIKESAFWDAFRFTKDGRFKSTLLIYSFSLSFVFIAVYTAAYWLLLDPLELGLRPHLGVGLLILVESLVPALLGSLVCCSVHFISHDKKMVLFTYGWIVLFVAVLGGFCVITFSPQEMELIAVIASQFVAPPLVTGIALASALYVRHRKNDPFKRYQSLPDWQKNR